MDCRYMMKKPAYIAFFLLFCFSIGVKHSMAQANGERVQIDAFVNELDVLAANATKHRYQNSPDVKYRMIESAIMMNQKIVQAIRDKMRLDKKGTKHLTKAEKQTLAKLNTKLNLLANHPLESLKRVKIINERLKKRLHLYNPSLQK